MTLTQAERNLKNALHFFVFVFLLLALVHVLGAVLTARGGGLHSPLFTELPFVSLTAVKSYALALLCLFASGDIRGKLGLVRIALVGQLLSIALLVLYVLTGDSNRILAIGDRSISLRIWMWVSAALDAVIFVALAIFFVRARMATRAISIPQKERAWDETYEQRRLRLLLRTIGFVYVICAIALVAGPFIPAWRDVFSQLPFIGGSAVAAAVLGMLCLFTAKDLGRRLSLVSLLIWAHAVSGLVNLIFLFPANVSDMPLLGDLGVINILTAFAALDLLAALVLFLAAHTAWRARLEPGFLQVIEYRTMIAIGDVLVLGPDESIPPDRIAKNLDTAFVDLRASRRWIYRVVLFALYLHPLLYGKAPISELDDESRLDHMKKHFYLDVSRRALPKFIRQFVQVMMRVAQQLAYVGYYNDEESFDSIGYTRFSQRPRFEKLEKLGAIPEPKPHPLKVERPIHLQNTEEEAQFCVIGSGAAGAILAYRLAEMGYSVILLERGRYVQPAEFNENEVDMISKLYADGIFQQTQDFNFTVLQGSCVGGTTVVNNAVCFSPPERVLHDWNGLPELSAGLDLDELKRSDAAVRKWLHIHAQEDTPKAPADPHLQLNPSYPKFLEGIGSRPFHTGPVEANIEGCLGCGYCNIGCKYGKKLSMLDTVLPQAQAKFGDRVRILAECEVKKIETNGNGEKEATAVVAKLSDGRTLRVRASKVVVAAGAIASSWILGKSGFARGLPVGRHVSFNMGAAMTAEYRSEEFKGGNPAYDGLQISHFGVPPAQRGWVYETWWNPPVGQALNMPGWFEQHYRNMRSYEDLMAVGVLVGTERNARITRALMGGPDIAYVPTPGDLRKLADGLIELGTILFETGARRVMVNAWNYYEFHSPHALAELTRIVQDPTDLRLGTGHPQGGNAISTDPALGVVDSDFRVHGTKNLYVCDASVFPSSLTVNPQLTVMDLAHYAAPRIANSR